MSGTGEVILIVVLLGIVWVLPILGIIDAARRPAWAFQQTGENKNTWIVFMILSFVPFPIVSLAGIGASAVYFVGRRKKILAAQALGQQAVVMQPSVP